MTIAEKIARAKADYDEVYEAGKKSEYDAFWYAYQKEVAWSCNGAFSGVKWTPNTFKPKYDIKDFESAQNMFWASNMALDLVELLEELGVVLDFSSAKSVSSAFAYSKFTRLGVLDFSKATIATGVFVGASNLVTIDKIIVSANTQINTWFNNCDKLENVIFEGETGQNGLNLQWSSKLSKASIESVINTLSTTTSGLSVTLSKTAVNNAFTGGSTGSEWLNLIATKNNWTINLI